jgi:Ca-activated chloride channel homolog
MNLFFLNPHYLWFVLTIPLFIFLHFASIRGRNKRALKFANFNAISRVSGIDIFSKSLFVLVANSIIILLLVFSLSGAGLYLERDVVDHSFVFVLDVSQSMVAKDVEPNRLEYSKEIAIEFLRVLPEKTSIGLVSFGAYSFIEQEVGMNKQGIESSIKNLEISSVGGTGIYEAVVTASNILYNQETKAIVLFSDGQENIQDIELTIRHARNKGVVIHTVPIGTEEGGEVFYGVSKLNKENLMALSYQTKGEFIEGDSEIEMISNFEEALEKKRGLVRIDLFNYLILLAILIFVLEAILINLKYGSFP